MKRFPPLRILPRRDSARRDPAGRDPYRSDPAGRDPYLPDPSRSGRGRSIRTRVLTIVIIPSAILLVLGVGGSGYLVWQGYAAKSWAARLQDAIPPATRFISQIQEERRLTLLRMGGDAADSSALAEQRRVVDAGAGGIGDVARTLFALDPDAESNATRQLADTLHQLPGFRQQIDAGNVTADTAYTFYNQLVEAVGSALEGVAGSAPDPATATQESTAADLFSALDSMSRANALAAGGVAAGGLSVEDLREFENQVGAYHTQLTQLLPRLTNQEQARYGRLAASPAWEQLSAMESAVADRGPRSASGTRPRALPLTTAAWQDTARQVTGELAGIWSSHHQVAGESARQKGERLFSDSLVAGGAVLIVALVSLLFAVRLSRCLFGRLNRLRAETLELAEHRLPAIVDRLWDGDAVDLHTEIPLLDHGRDEIGQVAGAFNKAQQTAVAAAMREAGTRRGMRSVFLNIAHRSQLVVRRQMEVLDEAEKRQDDPSHLELLFRLDHLATRSRRNAENLIILGGGRPGRRWRHPVPLEEIVRSAVSETEDLTRVGSVRLPELAVEGAVVADLIHLVAELVDNATSFSPPTSRVEVRGNVVGKGVAIEIEDQGLGIEATKREQLNAMLHDPPDFQAMAASGRMRLGLFVVAQLAARHNISVTLTESDYGGIRAIVLVPSMAVASGLPVTGTGDEPRPAGAITAGTAPGEPAQPAVPAAQSGANGVTPTNGAHPVNGATPTNGAGHTNGASLPSGASLSNGGVLSNGASLPSGPAAPGQRWQRYTPSVPFEETELDASWLEDDRPTVRQPAPGAVRPVPPIIPPAVPPVSQPIRVNPRSPEAAPLPPHTPGVPTPGVPTPGVSTSGVPQPNAPAAGAVGSQPHTRSPLPRRNRQESLAPQLAADASEWDTATVIQPAPLPRRPEQARDTMAALVRGTRQGRQTAPRHGREPEFPNGGER